MGTVGSGGATVLAGLVGILVGAALLGGALLALQARRMLWVVVVVASVLGVTTLAGIIWAVVASGSLLIAALAVGAALGSACAVAIVFALLISARLLGDWRQAARLLAGRSPYAAPPAGGYPPGYPGGYPGGAANGWAAAPPPGRPGERRW